MEKINDFRILELAVSGFKGFSEPRTFTFDYGVNFILGDNGQGKTSIAEAIAFAFMGTGFFGEKALDRLQNPAAREVSVSVRFADESGEVHELSRVRKSNATGITYDGYTIRQADLCSLFGDKDLFLSMFNPLYFTETLGADGKNLLEKLLPAVSHEAVLAALPEDSRAALANENILSPETYLKNRRAEIRELEEDMIYMQGQADLLEGNAKKARAELERAKAELVEKNTRLHELEGALTSGEQKASLRAEMSQLKQASENGTERGRAIAAEISEAKLRLQRAKETAFVFSGDAEILRLETELEAQYARYDAAFQYLHQLRTGLKCTLCQHEMTDEDVLAAREGQKRQLEQYVAEGKALKAGLKQLGQQKEAERQAFEEEKFLEAAKLERRIAMLEVEYRRAAENNAGERLRHLEAMLEYGSLSQEQAAELDALRQRCRGLENEIQRLSGTLEQPDVRKQLQNTQEEIEAKKRLASHALCYMGKKNELLFRPLRMNKARIVLSEVLKTTGEAKDVFKFTYDGKDYAKLSLSEKMRAGLEAAEMIKRLSGRRYPTFLDNGESISVIDNVRPSGQLMLSKVVKGQALAVLPRNSANRNAGTSGKAA